MLSHVFKCAYNANEDAADAVSWSNGVDEAVAQLVRSPAFSDTKLSFDDLSKSPLWHDRQMPKTLEIKLHEILNWGGTEWSFWREWYQGFLDGKPLDWGLQKEIALIPDAEWEKGPERIAELIEIIRKRRALEAEIAKLKEHLAQAKAIVTTPGRLHNQPPEAVEDETQFLRREITLVWGQIEDLEQEIAKPDPSPTVLARIASRLKAISISIAKYCAGVADASVKAAAISIGATAGAAITAEAALPGSIQAVVKAILEFAKALGG